MQAFGFKITRQFFCFFLFLPVHNCEVEAGWTKDQFWDKKWFGLCFWKCPLLPLDSPLLLSGCADPKASLPSSFCQCCEQNHSHFPLKCFSLQSGRVGPVDSGLIFHSCSKLGSFYFSLMGNNYSLCKKKEKERKRFALTVSKGYIKSESLFNCWQPFCIHSFLIEVSA